MMLKNKIIYNYLIITTLPKVLLGIPILIIGMGFVSVIPYSQKLFFAIFGTIIFLEIIYYLIHLNRLKRILELKDVDSLFKTPILTSIHTGLNFMIFAPVILLGLNHLLQIAPLGDFLKGVWHVIPVGFIELSLVYCIGYFILTPYLKSFEGIRFKGLSLTEKLFFVLIPLLLFSLYNGYLLTKSWVGYIFILLPLFLIYSLIRIVVEPVNSLIESFDGFLSGNSNFSMKGVIVSGDEFEALKEKFQSFLQKLSSIIDNIKEFAKDVQKQAETLSTQSNGLNNSREEIHTSIKEINSKTQDINVNIELIHHHIENLSSMSSELESEMQILNNITKKSVNLANIGEEISEEAVNMIQTGVLKMKESIESLEVLTKSFSEIKGFSSMMETISKDTNLLALNASIEAARVGKGSEGFTVIAEEIRKLSDDSARHLKRMTESIKEMNKAVQSVANTINENKTISSESKEKVEKTKAKLTDISESIAMTMNMVEQVPEVLKEALGSIKEISEAVTLMSEIATKQLTTTEGISSIAEEQNAKIEETKALANRLFKLSDKMVKGIERYID